jgi:hypothetical protein
MVIDWNFGWFGVGALRDPGDNALSSSRDRERR